MIQLMKQPVVYTKDDQTSFTDQDKKYTIEWLIPTSNEKEMEPVILTLKKDGEFKQFEPSLSETFIYRFKWTYSCRYRK